MTSKNGRPVYITQYTLRVVPQQVMQTDAHAKARAGEAVPPTVGTVPAAVPPAALLAEAAPAGVATKDTNE